MSQFQRPTATKRGPLTDFSTVDFSACGQGVVVVSFPPMTSQLGQIPRSGVKDGRVSSRRSRSARSITAKTHILRRGR